MNVRIGRYELVRLLGEGGQGRVYEAVLLGPAGFRKSVALKVLHSGSGLEREARIGGLLRHPNLVDVFEVGVADGTWFCAMELCRGGALVERLPLSERAVVEVGRAVCTALQYASDALGLVHLDLKPQNLLRDGAVVKVSDLGLAHARGFAHREGRIEGTRGYMAPEQARGGRVDARTDIYALGVVLRVLATGVHPTHSQATFSAEDLATEAVPEAPPVPAWLAEICDRCCADLPEDRFPSMSALGEALAATRPGGPSLAETFGERGALAAAGPAADLDDGESDPFVGRVAEVGALAAHLAAPGLWTLKGPGGIGKTRLARESVARWRAETQAEAWFCSLAHIGDAAGLVRSVATRLRARSGADPEALGRELARRGRVALVLDNLEQIAGAAEVIARLRTLAPEARLVCTSRVPLRLPGETVIEVGRLLPDDAVSLLQARAAARGAPPQHPGALRLLAARLDGMPLALELAAGRIGVLSAEEVVERLDLSLLRGGDTAARQGTLRNALDWSWDLLTPDERRTLAELSTFQGGFTLPAAEAVLFESDAWVGDRIGALAERSLVQRVSATRFALLRPIVEYAAEKREGESACLRHAAHFATFGGASRIASVESSAAFGLFVAEVDNLEAAARYAIAADVGALAVGAVCALWTALQRTGPFGLAEALADATHGLPSVDAAGRGRVAAVAGQACRSMGRLEEARAWYERGLAASAAGGDRRRAALTLGDLANVAFDLGRDDESRARYEEALVVFRSLGEHPPIVLTLCALGALARQRGDFATARARVTEGLEHARLHGIPALEANALGGLALTVLSEGDLHAGLPFLEAGLAAFRRVGDRVNEAILLVHLGCAQGLAGREDEGLTTLRTAERIASETGHPRIAAAAYEELGLALRGRAALAEAIAWFRRAVALLETMDNPTLEGRVRAALGGSLALSGAVDEGGLAVAAAASLLAGHTDPAEVALLLSERAIWEFVGGQPERARATVVEAWACAAASPRRRDPRVRDRVAFAARQVGAPRAD